MSKYFLDLQGIKKVVETTFSRITALMQEEYMRNGERVQNKGHGLLYLQLLSYKQVEYSVIYFFKIEIEI